jgi:hypothetical protein
MHADLNDYRMQVRNALHNLRLVEQVLTDSVRVLERQDTPAPGTTGPVVTPEAIACERISRLPDDAELTEAEAAAWLHCSVSLLRQWRWQGRGPAFEGSGRRVRYSKRALDALAVD